MGGFVFIVAVGTIGLGIYLAIEERIIKSKQRKYAETVANRKAQLEFRRQELQDSKRIVYKAKK